MNRILFLIIVIYSLSIKAQDVRFTSFIYTEPNADRYTDNKGFDYGFNIGAGIEWQGTVTYVNVDVYWFPNLNDVGYIDFEGTLLGFNHHNRFRTLRYYIGVLKAGLIKRDRFTYPQIASDIGIDYYFADKIYAGVNFGYNYRSDNKYWGVDEPYWSKNAHIRLGITF